MNPQPENERGQAIVIMAFMMIALLAFAALAIDGGNAYVERRRAQNASDAAALAGARQLWLQMSAGKSSEASIRIAMNKAAEDNNIADTDNAPGDFYNDNVVAYYTTGTTLATVQATSVQVGTIGSIPPSSSGVQVTTKRSFNTFIAGIIGHSTLGAEAQSTAVIIPPQGCGNFAVFGIADPPSSNAEVSVSGGGQGLNINNGGVYSGDKVQWGNNANINNGTLQYANSCSPSSKCGDAVQGTVQVPPSWNFNDFRPGGPVATSLGSNYHYINGNLNSISAGDGLYFVNGDVSLHNVGPGHVTIVTAGDIKISGGVDLSAYYNGLLFFSNSSNSSNGAIEITGSDLIWQGLVYAPNGDVNMHGASNVSISGAIYGNGVSLSGAGININYDPSSCPPSRARIVLLK